MKRHYLEDNNYNPNKNVKHEEVIRVLRHAETPAGDPSPQARLGAGRDLYSTSSGTKSGSSSVKIKNGVSTNVLSKSNHTHGGVKAEYHAQGNSRIRLRFTFAES